MKPFIICIAMGLSLNFIAGNAFAGSFSVDVSSAGFPGTAVANATVVPDERGSSLFFSSFDPGQSSNTLIFPSTSFGLSGGQTLNSISSGTDPLSSDLWDLLFSVDRAAIGASGSALAGRASGRGHAGAAADIYFANPGLEGTNLLLTDFRINPPNPIGGARQLGLLRSDNIDAMDLFGVDESEQLRIVSNVLDTDRTYFTRITLGSATDPGDGATIFRTGTEPLGSVTTEVYRTPDQLGLLPGDFIDALALLTDDSALFSLAPDNASGLRPGDIFYTEFDSTFAIAGPANISFPFDLIAENLGLAPGDNLNGLDLVSTSTFLMLQAPIPAAVWLMASALVGLIGLGRNGKLSR